MTIKDLILPDIERKIQGVVQVEQKDTLYQELKEYVVTKEHLKLFEKFFNNYNESFTKPNTDIGVWISGFFGSGKSHFLKILAYLLENKPLTAPDGTTTTPVEIFREKFTDKLFFHEIEKATAGETDIVLFNICIENSITNQEKYAVIKNFAKTFYDKLGYYGNNLKLVQLEKEIEEQGKKEEFSKVFEKYSGTSWINGRNKFQLKSKAVIQALQEVLGMPEDIAKDWISKSNEIEFSIKDLVADIKKYVDSKPSNYKFLFMLDEVGQFVGSDTSLLLELQSIVEQIGNECGGKVWVMCTGQEALDQVIKTGYETLGLQTFYTVGPKEAHAWTITRGMTAPQAAGKIHTDFEKGFIRAEIISPSDWLELGGELAVKEAGKMRTVGRDYIMQDGDICHFLFNN